MGSVLPLPQGLTSPPPAAIRRDPKSCEKLETTVLRLRRDQKGLGWAGQAGWGRVRLGPQGQV